MAFSNGKKTTDGGEIKRYAGVASCFVLDVNPNAARLSELYGREIEKEPVYINAVESNGKNVEVIRIDFIVKADPAVHKVNFTQKVSFFVRNEYRTNKPDAPVRKVQVIDKYGRTAWVTKEECKAHTIPQYKDGPARLDADYRPAYTGEEELTTFIKNYLNIPNVDKYNSKTGMWSMVANPEDSEARLEHVANYFKGDISELKTVIALQPENKVKILFGVRTNDDGKMYQDAFTHMTLKNYVASFDGLRKAVDEQKSLGRYANTEFVINDFTEFKPVPTSFDATGSSGDSEDSGISDDMPWD